MLKNRQADRNGGIRDFKETEIRMKTDMQERK